jgi:UDP-N-acetylglucosamine diphosphorylase/glucosamine-1-phosphate N-acetyltransferase
MAFRLDADRVRETADGLSNLHECAGIERIRKHLKEKRVKAGAIKYLWDLVEMNGERVASELAEFHGGAKSSGKIDRRAGIINRKMVRVVRGASIGPQAVIDATEGPVIIDKGAVVEPLTYIKGPCYVGQGSRLVGGKITEGCSFGPVCRVGGEVEETIMLGYCNKYHDGFLGHSYLGEWVNLGALTTNSDLKNNYAPISVVTGSQLVNSGKTKVGCFIGDHTKTGIGTLLNTGISIGLSCNLYGGGFFAERTIKSFSWGTPGNLVEYEIEKAIRTAAASMARRGIEFGEIHERLFMEIAARRRPQEGL